MDYLAGRNIGAGVQEKSALASKQTKKQEI